jgi:hypothetical protein
MGATLKMMIMPERIRKDEVINAKAAGIIRAEIAEKIAWWRDCALP